MVWSVQSVKASRSIRADKTLRFLPSHARAVRFGNEKAAYEIVSRPVISASVVPAMSMIDSGMRTGTAFSESRSASRFVASINFLFSRTPHQVMAATAQVNAARRNVANANAAVARARTSDETTDTQLSTVGADYGLRRSPPVASTPLPHLRHMSIANQDRS